MMSKSFWNLNWRPLNRLTDPDARVGTQLAYEWESKDLDVICMFEFGDNYECASRGRVVSVRDFGF